MLSADGSLAPAGAEVARAPPAIHWSPRSRACARCQGLAAGSCRKRATPSSAVRLHASREPGIPNPREEGARVGLEKSNGQAGRTTLWMIDSPPW